MKRNIKLSIVAIAAVLMATVAFGADEASKQGVEYGNKSVDNFADMFKEGKLDGRVRLQYFNTDWNTNDWGTKPDGDSRGTAVGGSLIYQTAQLSGFSAGAGLYTTQGTGMFTDDTNGKIAGFAKNTTASDLFARGPGADTNFGAGYAVLAQSYLQYDFAKSKIKGGQFLMTNPWINPNDTKMIPIAIQGAQAISNDIANTTIQLDFANKIKERGMTYFGSMADTGDTPDAIKNYYRTHYTTSGITTGAADLADQAKFGQEAAPAVEILGAKNKSIDSLDLQAGYMHWADIIDQGLMEANYAIKMGSTTTTLGARYMQQFDHGAGNIITPKDGSSPYATGAVTATSPLGAASKVQRKGDNDNSVDTNMYALRAVTAYGASKFLVAYSHTNNGGDLIAPWRGFPTEGYTRSMTVTDWNANTSSYKAQFDYNFNALVSGLSAFVSYSFYDRDPSKVGYQGATDRYYNNGDTRQWNIDAKYAVASMKGLELKARYMIQDNQILAATDNIAGNSGAKSEGYGNNTSNHELRLEANYLF
ncbi:MAG: OprD family outer membrane porin [Campylobacterales bacterium]|nr:OprD family outer membrane porin [Campylobacterales bacterium]